MVEELFLHTVRVGTDALNRSFDRSGHTFPERCDVISDGLTWLSFSPPYDAIPLQAATLAQMAYGVQLRLLDGDNVTLDDLPVPRKHISSDHLLAATEAAFGMALSLLHANAGLTDED